MNIDDYIQAECDRQHTTLVSEMKHAFDYASSVPHESFQIHKFGQMPQADFGLFVQSIASLVEPEKNTWWDYPAPLWELNIGSTGVNLRRSHVGFMNGGTACPTNEVPGRFERIIEMAGEDMNSAEIDLWIKSLLDIHPWVDGNGRTASILRNWMMGQMSDPEQLPFYYGE